MSDVFKLKKACRSMGAMIKAVIVLGTLGYCSLLIYQGAGPLIFFDYNLEERHPRLAQVSTIEPVTKSVSESRQNNILTLDDIFIAAKTTIKNKDTRFPIILKTWFQLAKNQTWFVTDICDSEQQNLTNGHMIITKCPFGHSRRGLCCKSSVEFDTYIESGKKWFCHFDDDNYVNVPRLVEVLRGYNYQLDWYLGRISWKKPFKNPRVIGQAKFWFATFGAGMCISRSLALKMIPVVSGGKFISICDKIQLPDDMTMGYVIEHLMKRKLTVVPGFHSHYDKLSLIPVEELRNQISFSYHKDITVNVPGFNKSYDSTRFLSLHCFLFPHFEFCPR